MYVELREHIEGDLLQLRHPPTASPMPREVHAKTVELGGFDDPEVMIALRSYMTLLRYAAQREEQLEESRYRQPDVVNSVAISALARI